MSIMQTNHVTPKIMIANEGIIDISLIETSLSNYGMTNVISTSNSEKVVDMINEYKPDLLLLDFDMPNIDGVDILQYIKENVDSNYSPAIIVCAEENSQKRIRAQRYDVYAIISKPFKSAEAMIAIWDFLKVNLKTKVC